MEILRQRKRDLGCSSGVMSHSTPSVPWKMKIAQTDRFKPSVSQLLYFDTRLMQLWQIKVPHKL